MKRKVKNTRLKAQMQAFLFDHGNTSWTMRQFKLYNEKDYSFIDGDSNENENLEGHDNLPNYVHE